MGNTPPYLKALEEIEQEGTPDSLFVGVEYTSYLLECLIPRRVPLR
jgi:hypothetical protein